MKLGDLQMTDKVEAKVISDRQKALSEFKVSSSTLFSGSNRGVVRKSKSMEKGKKQ